MTHKEMVYDIARLLQSSKLVDDSRISKRQIGYKIHEYRAIGIREEYNQHGRLDNQWLQNLGNNLIVEKINSTEDPAVTVCDCVLGKITLPSIVHLPRQMTGTDDQGLYSVTMLAKLIKYYSTTLSKFYALVPGSVATKFNYYFRIGQTLYIHEFREKINVIAILDNPFDAGIDENDQYPISHTLTEFIVMNILTKDFNIEAKMLTDIRNDAADRLVALQNIKFASK